MKLKKSQYGLKVGGMTQFTMKRITVWNSHTQLMFAFSDLGRSRVLSFSERLVWRWIFLYHRNIYKYRWTNFWAALLQQLTQNKLLTDIQQIQSYAARVVPRLHKYSHTPSLHWSHFTVKTTKMVNSFYVNIKNRFIISHLPNTWLVFSYHDDVIKWKHFPRYWPFVRGIHRSRWIPRTKASDAELWCFLWSTLNNRLSEQPWGWWFETPLWSLWRHCNVWCTLTDCDTSHGLDKLADQKSTLFSLQRV